MSTVQTLKVFVEQRLTAAAEEIFGLFEKTIAEYEQEVRRQRKLLDAVFKPEVRLHRAGRFLCQANELFLFTVYMLTARVPTNQVSSGKEQV